MSRGTVVAALVASLLLMTWLFVASYAATGEGRVAGIGRIVVVALLGYLVLQGRRWASFLLALWFGLTAFVLLVVAVGVGGVGRILVSLGFAVVFAVAGAIMWQARTRGVAPHDEDVPDGGEGRQRMRMLLVGAWMVAAASCTDPTSPATEGVHVDLAEAGLVVSNQRGRPIYYFAVERQAAALILWGPCSDPQECSGIDPGRSDLIPLDSVGFWEPSSAEVLFYWWHLVPTTAGGFAPDSIRAVLAGR